MRANASAEAPLPSHAFSHSPESVTGSGGLQPMVRQSYSPVCGNGLDAPIPIWKVPYKLWSLWDMIQYPVRDLCLWLTSLSSLANRIERYGASYNNKRLSELSGKSTSEEIKDTLEKLKDLLKKCKIEHSLSGVKRSLFSLGQDPFASQFGQELQLLYISISDELVPLTFMFIPAAKAGYYKLPKKQFPKSWNAFPKARDDMADACKCYAINQNSACVFHCMGVAQVGLIALAKRLRVTVNLYVDMWNGIIIKIEEAIKKKHDAVSGSSVTTRTKSNWKKIEPFYSEAIIDIRAMKDAWRNPTAHSRRQYDEDEAKKILAKVSDFMENIVNVIS